MEPYRLCQRTWECRTERKLLDVFFRSFLSARIVWVDVTKDHFVDFYRKSMSKRKMYKRATIPHSLLMDATEAFMYLQGCRSHMIIKMDQHSTMGSVTVVVMEG